MEAEWSAVGRVVAVKITAQHRGELCSGLDAGAG